MLRLNSSFFTSILKRQKKESREFFLTLHIKPYSIGAILLEKKGRSLIVVSSYESSLSSHVDTFSPQELLEYSDKAISSIENSVPQARDVEKTIFSLPNHWVEDAKIKKDHLLALKKITDDLSLVPIGFLISTEAIVHALSEKEGAPLSAILIEIINEQLFLSLVKQGKILEEDRATIQESAIATSEHLLHNLKNVEVLPSRILLIENSQNDRKQQTFVSHAWAKSIPFLHIPQVEVLDKAFEQESVIKGVSDQLGLEIRMEGFPVEKVEEESEKSEIQEDEDFGFMKEKDLSNMEKKDLSLESDVLPVEENREEVEEGNKADVHPVHISRKEEEVQNDNAKEEEMPSTRRQRKSIVPVGLPSIGGLGWFFSGIVKRPGLITIPIVGIGVVVLAWFVYTSYLVKTTVSVYAKVEEINLDEAITLSEERDGDDVLPLITFQEEDTGEVSVQTTGEKESGEKASGEITVFNKTDKEKVFPKGTTLVGTNKLEFVTTEDLTVASTAAFSTEFTSKKVKIEAKTFGKEYNLPSKTNFEFKEFPSSSYFARNDAAFSGGTVKTSQVVSEDDIAKLEEELVSSLEKKVKESVRSKLSPSQKLIGSPIEVDTSESEISNEEGDEVEEVSISGKVAITLGAYDEQDMEDLVRRLKDDDVPAEYQIDSSHSSLSLEDIEVDDGRVSAQLKGRAIFQPRIGVETLKKEVSGKTIYSVVKKISTIPGVSEVQVKQNFSLPILGSFISRNPNNIVFEVKAE